MKHNGQIELSQDTFFYCTGFFLIGISRITNPHKEVYRKFGKTIILAAISRERLQEIQFCTFVKFPMPYINFKILEV